MFRDTEYYFYSWRFLTATSDKTSELMFPICALPHAMCVDPDVRRAAMDQLAGAIVWSQNALDCGHWPLAGYYGEEFRKHTKRGRKAGSLLADGLRAHYAVFQADLKARTQLHNFSR